MEGQKKKETEKKAAAKKKQPKKTVQGKLGISIRVQLIIGFLIPVLFIVMVGSISYLRASEALVENYRTSSFNALEMTVTSLDDNLKIIQANVSELAQDATARSYTLGGFVSDSFKEDAAKKSISTSMLVKQTTNSMIHNMHIIPVPDETIVTTKTLSAASMDSFIEEMSESEDAWLLEDGMIHWSTYHSYLDTRLDNTTDEYALFCSQVISSGNVKGIVVADISAEAIRALLDKLDFGTGSQVSFITAEGREIRNSEITNISELAYFQENKDLADEGVAEYIDYQGKSYYLMMFKTNIAGGYVCAMVPQSTITAGSKSIRDITILLVVLASIVALVISTRLVHKISGNIQGSVIRLDRVSQGELILDENAPVKTKNEFGKLHAAIYTTVGKMRGLVETVKDMIERVSDTGKRVSASSIHVGTIVEDMEEKIESIHETIQKEDREIASCNEQMEDLSKDIKAVSGQIMEMLSEIEQSEKMIASGIDAVNVMTEQSGQTKSATDDVEEQVNQLGNKIEEIARFVEKIQSIAEETNLLSLNASIEAARAGENGKGFSVVAEEIRKLADSSAETAQTIQSVISDVRSYSVSATQKAHAAENIVALQVESVFDTKEVFNGIDTFMRDITLKMNGLTDGIEEMNAKRHNALKSIKKLSELSGDTVQSANQVTESLKVQVESTKEMENEALKLKENMKLLEESVASFKLHEDELE